MITQQVLTALSFLGFRPEEVEDFGFRFEYEGLTILYSEDDTDSKCLTLMVPNVKSVDADNRMDVLEAMVCLSGSIKYVQPYLMGDNQVWINYQHYLGEGDVTPDIIEHMVRVLGVATVKFHKMINDD